ncbi:hypothetical protein CH063_07896 [Colletotrichum higginsianum]|uniref:Secreted protein n=1 Tax=Colletotrichum higginsianum (strain IMI 349063) TaxID=759273 RepID=H1V7U5_COLHI|nr:hypothetical protein CH063_07896 [Colletotrichum higginsianum]
MTLVLGCFFFFPTLSPLGCLFSFRTHVQLQSCWGWADNVREVGGIRRNRRDGQVHTERQTDRQTDRQTATQHRHTQASTDAGRAGFARFRKMGAVQGTTGLGMEA